jgi:hypothetical protein
MVVNDDPANGYGIALSAPGYSLAAGAPVLFYGKNSGRVQYLNGPAAAAAEQEAAPYSVTVFTLRRA